MYNFVIWVFTFKLAFIFRFFILFCFLLYFVFSYIGIFFFFSVDYSLLLFLIFSQIFSIYMGLEIMILCYMCYLLSFCYFILVVSFRFKKYFDHWDIIPLNGQTIEEFQLEGKLELGTKGTQVVIKININNLPYLIKFNLTSSFLSNSNINDLFLFQFSDFFLNATRFMYIFSCFNIDFLFFLIVILCYFLIIMI